MSPSNFIILPENFSVLVDEADGNFLLSTKDGTTVLKVEKSSVEKHGETYRIEVGTPTSLVKGKRPSNKSKRVEKESYPVNDCPSNKKYCQNGVTLCCEPPHVITGSCEGEWSDC